MRHLLREFIWVLLTTACLAILPWWQTVIISALTTPLLLRLTERGFKRRLLMLFLSIAFLLISFHSSRNNISTAISKLFRLPHFLMLALLSAGCFSVVIALAAESVLWIKYSFRRLRK
ncbi:MAG: hypothetical protein RJB13_2432, partial [Pseudomonadota bacterium]